MELTFIVFLSSGLFLGWSLGANDAANVFGTAVGTRMLRFYTAAGVCAVFVVLGAVVSGAGASHGLGQLGSINALGGSFTVALAAAITVYGMTKLGLPVSTTQAIVGGIIGWNLFSATPTDTTALSKIVGTWVACPILGALFAFVLYRLMQKLIHVTKPHLLWLDQGTRIGLVLAGALGAYSLGANNIANVVGVFVPASTLEDMSLGLFTLSGQQRLFLLGGLAVAVGAFFSRRVMMTVGNSIVTVGPVGGWVVVVAHSMVLFVFASQSLQALITNIGLPAIPLVPVSSSQAVVGAVCGLALSHGLKGARQIKWSVLRNIALGWVATPAIAALISYIALYFVQNVFEQPVYYAVVAG
ncbi:MAG: inorganic phosphate transporter [Gemmatimonadota bacterium]|nr:MAG: inorganic phosphate transporter [Gemmatimonadota bacterium]